LVNRAKPLKSREALACLGGRLHAAVVVFASVPIVSRIWSL
jgi:hypothetical protein